MEHGRGCGNIARGANDVHATATHLENRPECDEDNHGSNQSFEDAKATIKSQPSQCGRGPLSLSGEGGQLTVKDVFAGLHFRF